MANGLRIEVPTRRSGGHTQRNRPPIRRVQIGPKNAELHQAIRLERHREALEEVRDARLAGRPLASEQVCNDPFTVSSRVVRGVAEVLAGRRSAAQLAPWVSPAVLRQLTERARVLSQAGQVNANIVGCGTKVRVRRVRLAHGVSNTAEAAVILEDDERVRAAAVQLDLCAGRWRVSCLELG